MDACQRSASRTGRFTPGKGQLYRLNWKLGGLMTTQILYSYKKRATLQLCTLIRYWPQLPNPHVYSNYDDDVMIIMIITYNVIFIILIGCRKFNILNVLVHSNICQTYFIYVYLMVCYINAMISLTIWCGFDRASSIIRGNKMPTTCNRWIFIADLIACSTCFGHLYAHHQEL
jgi:hypothetical protein